MAQTGESTSDSKKGETGKDSKNDSFDSVSTSLGYENKDLGLAIAAAGDFGIKGKYAAYGLKDVYTDAYRVTGSYDIAKSGFVGAQDYDNQVAVPFIALYDGVYTYDKNLAEGWNK